METIGGVSMAGEDIVVQSGLGRIGQNYKNSRDMKGKNYLAKVTKVHHKSNTLEVVLIKSMSKLTSAIENEGNLGVRITVPSGHFDAIKQTSSGVVEPIQVDQLVVIGFLDNVGTSPVMLGCFHDTTYYKNNILTEKYPLDIDNNFEDLREGLKYLRVTPSQMYHRIDGIGGIEVSLPSTTFLKVDIDTEDVITDEHSGFDHQDLKEKDPYRQYTTRKGVTEEAQLPVSMLFVHRSSFYDEFTTWTKMFLNREGMLRLSRDNNDDTLTFWELGTEGGFTHRRQLDSSYLPGSNIDDSKNYAELRIDKDANYHLERIDEESKRQTKTSLTLDSIESSYEDDNKNLKISSITDESGVAVKYVKGNNSSEIVTGENGVTLTRVVNGKTTVFTINEAGDIGFTHPSGSFLNVTGDGTIHMHAGCTLILTEGC